MSKTKKKGEGEARSLLYTTESPESVERTRADLKVPDPTPEKAKAILEAKEEKS